MAAGVFTPLLDRRGHYNVSLVYKDAAEIMADRRKQWGGGVRGRLDWTDL